jgi:hypothetical protein
MSVPKYLLQQFFIGIVAFISLNAGPGLAQNAVPMLINYQGELKSPSTGDPVRDGSYDMVFEIFTAETRGVSVWRGSYTAADRNPVEVKGGLFSVLLGSGTGNKMDASVFKESDRWLEISIEREALLPRRRITSAAYTLVSENSRLLGGKEPSEYVIQAQGLRLEPNATSPNIVAGHEDNAVTTDAVGATIGGGGGRDERANLVTDDYGTVGGGEGNRAGDNAGTTEDAYYATVGGGLDNTASGSGSTVGGGYYNTASGRSVTVGGGWGNTASDSGSTVGGGTLNAASGTSVTVGGGYDNTASGGYATVGGGELNTANGNYVTVAGGYDNTASDLYSTVGGGRQNTASGHCATVGGGGENTASASYATVPGGRMNAATGTYSLAGGRQAKADHEGAFVWGDSQDTDIASTAEDQVTFRCLGGVRFLSGSTGTDQTVSWAPGDSSWTFSSDRDLKDNFVEVDPKEVLDKVSRVPITEWNFKGYSQRHIGPVAQDFHALFPLGGSDTMIDSGDLQGVSLAAIQGLHKIAQEKGAEISTLRKENAELESRLAALEALVQTLVQERKGGEQ